MATKYTYDPVKAAEVSALIKSGIDEETAFKRAGIPEEAYGAYALDDVPGSPTRGQVIKSYSGSVTVYSEEEEKAMAAAEAKKTADQEAAREKRNQEIAAEREKNLERIKKEREAEKEAAKKGWVEEEEKAEKAGPADTRTTNTVTTTSGGYRETKMTAEMRDWTDKSNAAYNADEAATAAAKQEYLRSQGLDQASPSARRAALREAEANGTNFAVTTNKDALGAPPAKQYEDITVPSNTTGQQIPNDGSLAEDRAAINSAEGQTAEAAAVNDLPSKTVGAGQGNNNAEPAAESSEVPLTDSETKKLNSQASTENLVGTDRFAGQANTDIATGEDHLRRPPVGNKSEATAQDTSVKQESINVGSDNANGSSAAVNQTIPASLLRNKLHDFTSYTYKLTLYLLTVEDYQRLNKNPANFTPRYVLISSGGGVPAPTEASDTTGRHPDFLDDFYFDNFSMTTVVGLNSRSKASNAIDIRFNLIEPHGMTLLDRLLSACQVSAECTNYVDQPYMLQIDFLSNPIEEGQHGARGHLIDRKRLAIRFTEFKIKPGVNGTTYAVKAIPYNHAAFNESAASCPVNLSVEAATVGDFFDSTSEVKKIWFDESAAQEERGLEAELKKLENIPEITPDELEKAKAKKRAEFIYSTKSFPAGYNTYFRNIAYGKEKRFEQPLYQVVFNIHDDIAKSNIINPGKTDPKNAPLTESSGSARQVTATGTDVNAKKANAFNVLAGTDIVSLIDRVVSASEYIKTQVRNAEAEAEKQAQQDTDSTQAGARTATSAKKAIDYKATNWYKVIPSVTIGQYDKVSRAYSKVLTYSIMPYRGANFYHPDFKFTQINKAQAVRTYNYFYTGLNEDIINLDIDFDATFVTGITTYTKQLERVSTLSTDEVVGDENKAPSDERAPSWLPFRTVATPADTQYGGQANRHTAEDFSVASVARSLYSNYPRGDMLNLRIKIVGDPAFIKQDDVLYQPPQVSYAQAITKPTGENSPPVNLDTGQIIFDSEQVYVQIIVKGVVDIDDTIGITNKSIQLKNGQTANGSFSGIYRVMTVVNEFSKGKFEQTLDLIRVPDDLVVAQADPNATSTANSGFTAAVASDSQTFPTNNALTNPQQKPDGVETRSGRLIEAANGPATNPTPTEAGDGRPSATTAQPATAAPSNVNSAPNADVQQTNGLTQADYDNAVAGYTATFNAVVEERNNEVITFNSKLRAIRAEFTLTQAEKNQQIIALREALYPKLQGWFDQYKTLFQQVFALKNADGLIGKAKLDLLGNLNVFGKQVKEAIENQNEKIATLKADIENAVG